MKLIVLALAALAGSATAFVPMASRPMVRQTVRFSEPETAAEVTEVATEEAAEEAVVEATPEPAAAVAVSAGAFESALGAQAPLGFFDPLGMLAEADQERFDRLRFVEIKHGRIAMLAVLGQIVTKAGIRLPGDIDMSGTHFSDIGTGWSALGQFSPYGTYQMVAFVGCLELFVMKDIEGTGNEFPGDFRNGALDFGWDELSEEDKLSKRAIELNNGRAAQMGILALMVHEQLGVSIWPGGI